MYTRAHQQHTRHTRILALYLNTSQHLNRNFCIWCVLKFNVHEWGGWESGAMTQPQTSGHASFCGQDNAELMCLCIDCPGSMLCALPPMASLYRLGWLKVHEYKCCTHRRWAQSMSHCSWLRRSRLKVPLNKLVQIHTFTTHSHTHTPCTQTCFGF